MENLPNNNLQNYFGLASIEDFAKMWNSNPSTIRTWKLRGVFPPECFIKMDYPKKSKKKDNSRVYVSLDEVKKFLESKKGKIKKNDSLSE